MITNINYVLIPVMLVALLALWPAWLLLYRVTFSSHRWWISALRLLLVPIVACGFGALAFWLPFWLSSDQTVGPLITLTDLLLYGVFPLVAVGLVAYAIDHFSERPMMIVIATASCLSIAGLPIAYFFLADEYHQKYNIQLEEVRTAADAGLSSPDDPTPPRAGETQNAALPANPTADEGLTKQDNAPNTYSEDAAPKNDLPTR